MPLLPQSCCLTINSSSNEPRSARKPIRLPRAQKSPSDDSNLASPAHKPPRRPAQSSAKSVTLISDPSPVPTPSSSSTSLPVPSQTPTRASTTRPQVTPMQGGKSTRVSQKALAAAKRAQLERYARELFDELNEAVFESKLPETKLVWNVRLQTTAGRAHWHKYAVFAPNLT